MWEQVELRELRVFLTLREHLHSGEAADELRISHSRVSHILQELEAKLGMRLFDRSSRRVTLTPAGAGLRTRLAEPYEELREVLRETRARAEHVNGELRLASDQRILAVAIDHPHAKRESIAVEDLADCQAHDAGGRLPREYIDTLVPPRTPSGRRIPRRHIGTPSPTQLLAMVARDEVVHPTISSFPDHFRHPGVTFVPTSPERDPCSPLCDGVGRPYAHRNPTA
jgi:DNA-binding transcriptional LysR family regulator